MKKKIKDLTMQDFSKFCEKYAQEDCLNCPIKHTLDYPDRCPCMHMPVGCYEKEVEIDE